jgi:hypothetical protein
MNCNVTHDKLYTCNVPHDEPYFHPWQTIIPPWQTIMSPMTNHIVLHGKLTAKHNAPMTNHGTIANEDFADISFLKCWESYLCVWGYQCIWANIYVMYITLISMYVAEIFVTRNCKWVCICILFTMLHIHSMGKDSLLLHGLENRTQPISTPKMIGGWCAGQQFITKLPMPTYRSLTLYIWHCIWGYFSVHPIWHLPDTFVIVEIWTHRQWFTWYICNCRDMDTQTVVYLIHL